MRRTLQRKKQSLKKKTRKGRRRLQRGGERYYEILKEMNEINARNPDGSITRVSLDVGTICTQTGSTITKDGDSGCVEANPCPVVSCPIGRTVYTGIQLYNRDSDNTFRIF